MLTCMSISFMRKKFHSLMTRMKRNSMDRKNTGVAYAGSQMPTTSLAYRHPTMNRV